MPSEQWKADYIGNSGRWWRRQFRMGWGLVRPI